jgi:formylglycine-generating enzyme
VKALVLAVAEGLVACHAQGVIHRDIKPENIMFDGDRPVLIDFGIAHQEDGDGSGQTSFATGGYAPPEQLKGQKVGSEADLYALGMTAIECFGGARHIPESLSQVFEKITHSWPSRRGTAVELVEVLKGGSEAFHVIGKSGQPEGPFKVKRVVALVVEGESGLLVWKEGLSGWMKWSEVPSLKDRVDQARRASEGRVRPPVPKAISVPPPAPIVRRYTAGDVITQSFNEVSVGLAYCPAGEFWMGSKDGVGYGNERPRHKVRISKPFLMGQMQVTQALWQAVMGNNPSYFKGSELPVEQVSWFDSVRFCNKLSQLEGLTPAYSIGSGDAPKVEWNKGANGYRLPTEAEWEYAAKAGTELRFAGSNNIDEVAWYGDNSDYESHPVGQKKANAWGLYDCSGNVLEWCNDQWDSDAYNRSGTVEDPSVYGSAVASRSLRGGGWDFGADNCRVAYRFNFGPGDRVDYLGFRFLRKADA